MLSIGYSVRLLVAVLSGYVLHVTCQESRTQCVDTNNVCYFTPNVSLVDWETAWKICGALDATLPVILSEEDQKVLRDYYLSEHFPTQVWTAGRYVGSDSKWRWLNGENFSGPENPSCRKQSCFHETQAVLTKQLTYDARYPENANNFICSFPASAGVNCTSEPQRFVVMLEDGCLKWENNNRLRLNGARNVCLKRGGDLATFSDSKELELLRQYQRSADDLVDDYWIGLHRKWWIWNTTVVNDIRYNLLTEYANDGKDCLFSDERSMWQRDQCSATKTVVCQKEIGKTHFTASVIIGIVVAALAVAITVMVLLIFIKKRWRVAKSIPHSGGPNRKPDRLTPAKISMVEFEDNTYATIDVDDDVENLNYANGPNPITPYTKVEFCDDPSTVYSDPIDLSASDTKTSTKLHEEPYSNSAEASVAKDSVSPYSNIYAAVNKAGQQMISNDLFSPPIKIGPRGDIYTLPMSHN